MCGVYGMCGVCVYIYIVCAVCVVCVYVVCVCEGVVESGSGCKGDRRGSGG